MIEKIRVQDVATFSNGVQVIDELKKLNFIYGGNGTGKTTISNIIENSKQFQSCDITWKDNIEMETFVYNRDFVERNFKEKIPGVFTLGETQGNTLQKIETATSEMKRLKSEIAELTNTLQGTDGNSGKRGKLTELETTYTNRFWELKQKYDDKLASGLKGVRNSKEMFKAKVLEKADLNNVTLLQIDTLAENVKKIFSSSISKVNKIDEVNLEILLSLESEAILKKRIIGKEDIDIAAMYNKLSNSDWVHQGVSYYNANDGLCPFCQQMTETQFSKSLSEYFDETFEQDNVAIDTLIRRYTNESEQMKQRVQRLIDLQLEFLDNEKLQTEKRTLDSLVEINIRRLEQKKKEMSREIELDTLTNSSEILKELIVSANGKIEKNNIIYNDLDTEKEALTKQIWKFITEELKNDISDYKCKKQELQDAIKSLEEQINVKGREQKDKESELRDLEKEKTSIQPTLDALNSSLRTFGFQNFKLGAGKEENTYRLIRADGADAQKTLSEGERNFVTFLYFYYLLRGSQSESGFNSDKIVVFDDPVSSLDSDVLFIVSTLIRELAVGMLQNDNEVVKQMFVLTHSVYFHKEVTYTPQRLSKKVKGEMGFWLIKKRNSISTIERHDFNPIQTTYELLWSEVRAAPEARNSTTIRNTLRRILESYFKWLGDSSIEDLHKNFEGEEKIVFQSLCSWLNAGSHDAFHDEHDTAWDSTDVERGLEVFRKIFNERGQINHYNMMMKISVEEETD